MKKVAFIYRDISFQAPLGLMYLSAFLKKAGHECMLFLTERDDIRDLKEFEPDFLCYTVTTSNFKFYVDYNRKLRAQINAMSLFGGPHATFFPDLVKEDGIDGVCRGEGEEALLELVSKIDIGEDYLTTGNWVFKTNGGIVENKCRRLSSGIDGYPFPDRKSFFKTPQLKKSKVWIFIGSRGCPYQCSYCHNHLMRSIYDGDYKVRYRTPSDIIAEMRAVREEYPLRMAIFTDDTFNLNKKWLKEFSELYAREMNIPYACYVRADLMDEEVGECLRRSNCTVAYMGIESGSEDVRRRILNRPISDEAIVNAAAILNKNKIKIVALNILGIPGTTFDDDIKTLEMNIKCRPYQALGQLLQPYPNTKIYDYSVSLKLFDAKNIQDLGDIFTDSKLAFPHDQLKKVTYLRDLFPFFVSHPFLYRFFAFFLLFPRKIFYILSQISYGYSKFKLYPIFNSPSEILSAVASYYRREKKGVS